MIKKDPNYAVLSQTAHEWRAKVSHEDATQEDRNALQAWLDQDVRHEEAYDRALTLWTALDHLKAQDINPDLMPDLKDNRLSIWAHIQALFELRSAKIGAFVLAAALIAAPAGVFLSYTAINEPASITPETYEYATGIAGLQTIALGDGSSATLGADTQIEVTFSDNRRIVRLISGAAFFDVAHDPARPFFVQAEQLTARALGTQFDVRNNGGVFRVAVSEGQVRVTYPLHINGETGNALAQRTLSQGQGVAATLNAGLQDIYTVELQDVAAWRDYRLVYDGATLAELLSDANRHHEMEIIVSDDLDAISNTTITASFDAENIDRMLRLLAMSYPIEIDRTDPGTIHVNPLNN